MASKLNPFSSRQYLDSSGNPYVGAKLFVYTAGSSTKATVTKDSAGVSAHANPIILNARGEVADGSGASQAIWQDESVTLKLVLAPSDDVDPPIAAISSWDNLAGVNDTTVTIDQWVSGNTPTYVGATSFTLVGDQTTGFHVGRRLKTTNTNGTIYSTIITSAYTSLTTITVVNDSGTLDSGLSAVSYGILSANSVSSPSDVMTTQGDITYRDSTRNNRLPIGSADQHLVINEAGTEPEWQWKRDIESITGTVAASDLTLGLAATAISFRSETLTTGAPDTRPTSTLSLVVPSGATLGTIDTIQSRLILLAINNSGTVELAVVNIAGGNNLDETTLISTTTIGTGSDSDNVIYSTTGRSNVAFRVVGFIESTQTTAGTWATSPSTLQGAGGNALTSMSSLGYGQTYQDVSGSRSDNTTYYNTTGKPIGISVQAGAATNNRLSIYVDGVNVAETYNIDASSHNPGLTATIPVNSNYKVTATSTTYSRWYELR